MEQQLSNRERNRLWLSYLETPGQEKRASDAINSFTRVQMREDSFARKILDPVQIPNDEFDRQVDTDKPVKVIDKEPGNPPAISLPFAAAPINIYIKSPRYRVLFDRILTPRFTKDVDELRTYVMDIRQVMSDNAIKDMLAEEDSKFLSAVNTALGTVNVNNPISGVPQWVTISGGMSRDATIDGKKVMNRTPFLLEPARALTNFVSWKEFEKWGRDEMGGDLSQDVIKNGLVEARFEKLDWLVTIKRTLVPDQSVYYFSDPKFIGKSFILEDCTMFVKREYFMLEYFAYESMGGAIGHIGGLARVDYQ
jgi:hypothetical protein